MDNKLIMKCQSRNQKGLVISLALPDVGNFTSSKEVTSDEGVFQEGLLQDHDFRMQHVYHEVALLDGGALDQLYGVHLAELP